MKHALQLNTEAHAPQYLHEKIYDEAIDRERRERLAEMEVENEEAHAEWLKEFNTGYTRFKTEFPGAEKTDWIAAEIKRAENILSYHERNSIAEDDIYHSFTNYLEQLKKNEIAFDRL